MAVRPRYEYKKVKAEGGDAAMGDEEAWNYEHIGSQVNTTKSYQDWQIWQIINEIKEDRGKMYELPDGAQLDMSDRQNFMDVMF